MNCMQQVVWTRPSLLHLHCRVSSLIRCLCQHREVPSVLCSAHRSGSDLRHAGVELADGAVLRGRPEEMFLVWGSRNSLQTAAGEVPYDMLCLQLA